MTTPIPLADATLRIGDTTIPLAKMMMHARYLESPPPAPQVPARFTFTADLGEVQAGRMFFESLRSLPPRHTLTLTRKRRDGSAIVDVVEVDRIDVVIARRGLKRPGQWTDATRARRHKRLVRASERRAGISRRGLVRGFPLHISETASAATGTSAEAVQSAARSIAASPGKEPSS